MYVDRFLHAAMYYPCNYGFIPHTLSDDGDPVDAFLYGAFFLMPWLLGYSVMGMLSFPLESEFARGVTNLVGFFAD